MQLIYIAGLLVCLLDNLDKASEVIVRITLLEYPTPEIIVERNVDILE